MWQRCRAIKDISCLAASVKIGSWIAISNLRSAPAGKDCEVILLVIRHQRILTEASRKKCCSHKKSINHQKDMCTKWGFVSSGIPGAGCSKTAKVQRQLRHALHIFLLYIHQSRQGFCADSESPRKIRTVQELRSESASTIPTQALLYCRSCRYIGKVLQKLLS